METVKDTKRAVRKIAGFTLIEMMVTILILVILVVGMGTGMSAAVRVYQESVFESDSASLAGILNTTLGDVFRYSEKIDASGSFTAYTGDPLDIGFVFTNMEYGVRDGYLVADGPQSSSIRMKNIHNSNVVDLVNGGSYPNMKIENFSVTLADYVFIVRYTIKSTTSDNSKDVVNYFRQLNP